MKKIFGLCLSLLLLSAVFSACGASPSSNHPAAGSGKQQSEENTETILSNETEDSENMGSNSTAKNLVVYFSMPETTEPENMSREEELSTVVIDGEVLEIPSMLLISLQKIRGRIFSGLSQLHHIRWIIRSLKILRRKNRQTISGLKLQGL